VLTGSGRHASGAPANVVEQVRAAPVRRAPPARVWNELLWPREWPLAHYEMSFLLPHFLKEGRGKLDVYFTRVYNPLWTNPDGFTWMEVLKDEAKIGCHVALTPTWSETAWFADYVLPMGHAGERHDLMSQETHAGQWIGFRQPVLRVAMERMGQKVASPTWEANPGEVWEESEFWIELSWRIDPDGSLGIRRCSSRPTGPARSSRSTSTTSGSSRTPCRACPKRRLREGLTPLEYMRKYSAFKVVEDGVYRTHEQKLTGGRARCRARSTDVDQGRDARDGAGGRHGGRRRRARLGFNDALAQARVLLEDA
jgi:hypothetical protein